MNMKAARELGVKSACIYVNLEGGSEKWVVGLSKDDDEVAENAYCDGPSLDVAFTRAMDKMRSVNKLTVLK